MKAAIFWILLFPSFLFTINAQSAEAAPYQHPETGLVFEENLGGLTKGNVRNFEEKYSGFGISIGYNAPGITATVYIYVTSKDHSPGPSPVRITHLYPGR